MTELGQVPHIRRIESPQRTSGHGRPAVLSRLLAPSATGALAGAVTALLAHPARAAPRELVAPSGDQPPTPANEVGAPAADGVVGASGSVPPGSVPPGSVTPGLGLSGLGTSAARFPRSVNPTRETVAATVPDATRRHPSGPTGLGSAASRVRAAPAPPADQWSGTQLYCPPHLRDDEALGETLNEGVVDWAEKVGVYPGQLDRLRAANFGRLIMLCHPGSDDADRLLAATKCIVAEWATDDHFLDEEAMGADPSLIGWRLGITYGAIDPVDLPRKYAPQLDQALSDEPVAVAYRSAFDHLAQYASASQLARLRHELCCMFLAYNHEANWRTSGRVPPVWEYLTHRHENSFLPPMVLVDPVAGYELPPAEFADRRVRRLFCLAGSASVILNDLYSMSKESDDDFDLPKLIAAEDKCSPEEAVERTVQVHNELMHTFEAEASVLSQFGSVALRRFLADIWAWLGGNREWHSTTARYRAAQ